MNENNANTDQPSQSSGGEETILEGYFECPVPLSIVAEALTQPYSGHIAGHPMIVTLPRAPIAGVHHDGAPLQEPDWHYRGLTLPPSPLPVHGPVWGEVTHWINEGMPMAVAVTRVRLRFALTREAGIPLLAVKIARDVPRWWATVAGWIEVLSGQDLSRLGPAEPGWHLNGTLLWTQLREDATENAVRFVGDQPARTNLHPYTPLTAAGLQHCFQIAENCGMPPAAWLLIRDARSMYLGYDHRRAAIDAGTAAELAITELIRTHLARKGLTDQAVEEDLSRPRRRTLGERCQIWIKECNGTLPSAYRQRLVDTRNDATHIKKSVTRAEAKDAIRVAVEIVAQAHPLDRGPIPRPPELGSI